MKNKVFLILLVLILNSCLNKKQNLIVGKWQRVSIKAGIIQTWAEKDSTDSNLSGILNSSNPLLESKSILILNEDLSYRIVKTGITEEFGNWVNNKDSLITISDKNLKRIYLLTKISRDSLVLIEPGLEMVETGVALGYFRKTEVKFKNINIINNN